MRKVEFKLVSSEGSRNIDTGRVIQRHQNNMARAVLADFMMLGTSGERGSFALSKSKSELFLESLQAHADTIAENINRHLLPKLWQLNGFNPEVMPEFKFGAVAPVDLQELGEFVRNLSSTGVTFTDNQTENALREMADLPEIEEDTDMLGTPPPAGNEPPGDEPV